MCPILPVKDRSSRLVSAQYTTTIMTLQQFVSIPYFLSVFGALYGFKQKCEEFLIGVDLISHRHNKNISRKNERVIMAYWWSHPCGYLSEIICARSSM